MADVAPEVTATCGLSETSNVGIELGRLAFCRRGPGAEPGGATLVRAEAVAGTPGASWFIDRGVTDR